MSHPVALTFAPDTANVRLARLLAAAMAARADLPLDQVEDVRLAVDEAVTQAIADCPNDGSVEVAFVVDEGGLTVTIATPSASGQPPAPGTFGWSVLTALVDSATAQIVGGVLHLRLRADRAATVQR
jgi:serine/threonine-protein kinase RsbW